MSTLAATNLKNEASASNNIVLNPNGSVTLSGTVSGATTFGGATTFSGASTFGSTSTFSGAATFANTSNFSGASTFGSTSTFSGASTFGNTTTFSGASTFGSTATFSGIVTAQAGAVAVIGTLTDGATITPDFAADCNFTVTLGGNRTLANPTNITAGQSGSIFIIQDGTGSRTLSWGSYWDFPGGTAPTLTTTSGAIDRVDYVVRSTTSIHTVFTANYS